MSVGVYETKKYLTSRMKSETSWNDNKRHSLELKAYGELDAFFFFFCLGKCNFYFIKI